MPHRLIGRTAGFGPVSRGSSPRGATKTSLSQKREAFFISAQRKLACMLKQEYKKLTAAGRLAFGYNAKCSRTAESNPRGATF